MTAFFVAAIHNGELPTAPAAQVLEQLSAGTPSIVTTEVTEQPATVTDPDVDELVRWGLRQWQLESQWRAHLGRRSVIREGIAKAGYALWKSRLRLSTRYRSRAWLVRQVEAAVSAKHQEAWSRFLQSDVPYALIMESDATWSEAAGPAIGAILSAIPSNRPGYVNLAGGLTHRRLAVQAASHGSDGSSPEGVLSFDAAVTNTSCAYLINRSMAETLLDYCRNHPADTSLGIDWLINSVFMAARASLQEITCWHCEPPVLIHGSLAGLTRSWHPAR